MIPRVAITDPFLIAFLFAVVAAVVCMGRASFATGLFCSTWSFAFNVDIGPSTMLRIGVGAMLCAGLAFSFKKRHGVGRTLTAPSVRNYVIVLAAWAGWIGITYVTGDQSELSILIIKNFVLYTLLPSGMILMFVDDFGQVRELAYGFLVASAIGGGISISGIASPASAESLDVIRGFSGVNYVTYAWGPGIAALLGMGLLLLAESTFLKALISVMIGICTVTLLLTGARQSAIAFGAALAFVLWVIARNRARFWKRVVIGAVLGCIYAVTFLSTDIGVNVLSKRWSLLSVDFGMREDLWAQAWNVFTQAPILGNGLTYLPEGDTAHNLMLDLLASQGIVGVLFLTVFVAVVAQAGNVRFLGSCRSEGRTWKVVVQSIMLFTVIHSSVSGSVTSVPHFFWAPTLLVQLSAMARRKSGLVSHMTGLVDRAACQRTSEVERLVAE